MNPIWVHFPGHGWIESMEHEGNFLFQEMPPDSEVGKRLITVTRIPGEPPPDARTTALILTAALNEGI